MPRIPGRIFLFSLVAFTLLLTPAPVLAHPNLNGTWVLAPTRSNFAGEPVIQTGAVTISEREHNIYISRSFNYDGETGGFDYSFSTDGRENSTIHKRKTFKSKAHWENGVLKVTTTRDGLTTVETFTLAPEGFLTMTIQRPDHQVQTLVFQRQ